MAAAMRVMRIVLVCSPAPREVFEQILELPEGTTVRDAVAASALPQRWPALDWTALAPGVWGRGAGWDQPLQEGDRIELCRPLRVDPKVARRERFQRQGTRTAGLFARPRGAGKKPGD